MDTCGFAVALDGVWAVDNNNNEDHEDHMDYSNNGHMNDNI